MKLENVIEKINNNDGVVDVQLETEGVRSYYIFKGECECGINGADGVLYITKDDSSAILNISHIYDFQITDESDDEYEQIVINNGVVKLCLIFVC